MCVFLVIVFPLLISMCSLLNNFLVIFLILSDITSGLAVFNLLIWLSKKLIILAGVLLTF